MSKAAAIPEALPEAEAKPDNSFAAANAGAVASGNGYAFAHSSALAGGLEKYPCGNPIPGACGGGLPPMYKPPFDIPQPHIWPIPTPHPGPDPSHPDKPNGGKCNAGFANSCCNGDNNSGDGHLSGGLLGPIFGGSCVLGGVLQGACSGSTRCCPTDQFGLINVNVACPF
ncbi:hypothetical protein EJ03DRAFT_328893 [Teratosphaeria nubilosa]|uniref:Hydrophobin n=1 Tax=Teratosphaeria nubilosa TaxID=161662 RepID=A0A6G1L448_9PEZI|nr:hypothetical protein EJ03DRAFT_328893 [Teratosphaeria nubilosa]